MLTMMQLANVKAAYTRVVDDLGVPATHTQAKLPNTITVIAAVGFSTSGGGAAQGEKPITNSYAVGSKVITIKATDLITPPEKHDRVEIGGMTYHIDFVVPLLLPAGELFGWRCISGGK